VSRRRWIGFFVLLVLIAGIAIALTRDGDGVLGSLPGAGTERETPTFSFEVRKVIAEPTTETPPTRLRQAASATANRVARTLDDLYFASFVDTDTWGEFESIKELFAGSARSQAEADLDVLTIGVEADTYEFLDPRQGKLSVKVLMDSSDQPVMAIATVRFTGVTEGEDGARTDIVSAGSYYLQPSEGAWRITAYRVDRKDALRESQDGSSSGSSATPGDTQ
jgi:hypothetical protein